MIDFTKIMHQFGNFIDHFNCYKHVIVDQMGVAFNMFPAQLYLDAGD